MANSPKRRMHTTPPFRYRDTCGDRKSEPKRVATRLHHARLADSSRTPRDVRSRRLAAASDRVRLS